MTGATWAVRDERLELVFTRCHPALSIEAQVALTLRSLGGLGNRRDRPAFLVPEATMVERLVRAKRKRSKRRADPPGRCACWLSGSMPSWPSST